MKQVPLFAGLSRKEFALLARLAEDVEVKQGKALCKEGTTGREFFAFVEGEAEVTREGERLASLGPGEFVGEIALLTDVPRTATVTATTPMRVFVLTRPAFRSLVERNPVIEQKVMRALAERVASLTDDPCA